MIMPQHRLKIQSIGAVLLIAASTFLFAWQPAYAAPPLENQCPRATQPPLPPDSLPLAPTDWDNFSSPGFTAEYTYLGLPIVDHETSSDPTNGGTAVSPSEIDLASGSPNGDPGQYTTPYYGYYNGGTIYDPDNVSSMNDDFVLFRMRLEGDPSAKDAFISRHWNILVDIDNDGYKEYWVDVCGSCDVKSTGSDILQVLYNNDNNQAVDDPDASRVYSFPAFNDEVANPNSYTRVVPAPDGAENDYWLEVQLPLWAFLDIDPSGTSGCVQQVTPDSPVGFVYSTSASNTNPLQKDWMMDLDYISMADPITFGDIVTISGEPRLYFADSNLQEVYFYTAAVDAVTPGDDIYTFVKYIPGNTDSNTVETLTVTVTNPRTGDDEQLTLVESTPSSGLFTNRGGADKPDTTNSPDAWITGITTTPNTVDASWSVEYSGGVWEVRKDGSLQAGTVTPGTEYTSPGGEISFTLYDNGAGNNDSITFDTYAAIELSSVIDNLSNNDSDNSGSLESSSQDIIQFSYNTGSRNYTTEADIIGAGEPYIQFTRANGLPSTEFQLTDDINTSDKLYITVTHPDSNTDPNTVETIYVSLSGNDNIYYNPGPGLELTETGPDTGIFRNTTGLDTQIDDGSVDFNDTIWEDIDGGTITATYNYNGIDYSTPSTLFYIIYGGMVSFTNSAGTIDVDRYTAGQDVFIKLDETFSAGDCGDTDPIQVTVTSPSGDSETIDLWETPSDSATFMNLSGNLSTAVYDGVSTTWNNGILEASHEDILTVTYTDCNDGDPDPLNDNKFDLAVFNSPSVLINEVFFFPNTNPIEGQTEYFQIYNSSSSDVNIFNYTVKDEDGFTYTFPENPQLPGSNQFWLAPGQIAYVFLYETDYSSANFHDSATDTYYLFTNGGARPSDQFGDPDDPSSDPAKPDENKADQLTLRDSLGTIIDYVGWSYTSLPSVDFLGDDSPAVIQDIWQDDAYKAVYDDPITILENEDIQYGEAITRSADGVLPQKGFDTDKPSDWIYETVSVFDEDSPLFTQAIIRSFEGFLEDGNIVLRWETASEIGTLGFYLYRRDRRKFYYELVNETLMPGLITSPQGGTYTFVDTDADPDRDYEYLLEEVEVNSNRNEYGPFEIKVSGHKRNPRTSTAGKPRYTRRARLGPAATKNIPILIHRSARNANRLLRPDIRTLFPRKLKRRSGSEVDALKITVLESGLYKLDTAEIADLFDLSIRQVKKRIGQGNLKLTNMGRVVAYQPMAKREGIYFYGQKIDSMYTAENIYWLSLDKGRRMSRLRLRNKIRSPADLSFTNTLHAEEDYIPVLDQPMGNSEDFWAWSYIYVGYDESWGLHFTTLPFEIDALNTSAETADITIQFVGGSMEGYGDDHHAKISINDTPVIDGDCSWKGIEAEPCKLSIPSSLLKEGQNTLRIDGILADDVGFSLFYVDSFEVNYERNYQAKENSLFFPGENFRSLAIKGFDTEKILILDVTRPDIPSFATKKSTRENDSYTLRFTKATSSRKLLAVAATAAKSVASIQPYDSNSLLLKRKMADYLIITPAELQKTAQNLADYRASQGYDVKVVLLNDLINEFNFGLASPEAIRKYLSYTYHYWRRTPGYVVLIGDGSYDYKDIEGFGGNLMPPLLVSTPTGIFASDNTLADVTGNGIPDMAIGRIPASSAAELQAVIDKIIQYESATGDWKEKALLLADKQYDNEDDFEFSSNWVSSLIPTHYSLDKIHLSDMDLGAARQKLIDGLNNGVGLTNYFGHAGLDQLGQGGLLLYTDVEALNSPQGSPVITAMTCGVGQFSFAPFDTLAEMLVVKENGGATAVWSSSGLSENSQARLLDTELYRALFENNENILGDAIVAALKEYAKVGIEPYHISIYNLLGDPALRMK